MMSRLAAAVHRSPGWPRPEILTAVFPHVANVAQSLVSEGARQWAMGAYGGRSYAEVVGRERVIDLARREQLTVRQLALRLGGYGGLAFVGTPATIADPARLESSPSGRSSTRTTSR